MTFRRRLKPQAVVDLVPMIDVVFQLVVFFMVSSTFVMTPGIALDLPSSTSSEPVVMNRIVVTVVSPDEIYLNRQRHTLATLNQAVAALAPSESGGKNEVKSAVIEGDKGASYNLMVQVLDVLRQNGYQAVNLRTLSQPGSANR